MSKSLILYTQTFPFGFGEAFLENEIEILSDEFEEILIFPKDLSSPYKRQLPNNVKVQEIEVSLYNGVTILKKHFFEFIQIFLIEFLNSNKKKNYIRSFSYHRSLLLQQIDRANNLASYFSCINLSKITVHYAYWTEDWATTLCILKRRKDIERIVSRVHGYDLFADRKKNKIIPYRNFQLKYINKIVAVSEYSHSYLKINHPKFMSKFHCYPLGIKDNGGAQVFDEKAVFTIVSCSNVIPLKRVHLIPEILKGLTFPVKWVHFGDGEEMKELKDVCKNLPDYIETDLKGIVINSKILEFYSNNHCNLFLHISETEGGIPVSIQEATSFGIPVLATDAGGVSEIVNPTNGDLISVDFELHQVSELINKFKESEKNTLLNRKKVRQECIKKFYYKTNHTLFINEILKSFH